MQTVCAAAETAASTIAVVIATKQSRVRLRVHFADRQEGANNFFTVIPIWQEGSFAEQRLLDVL
jgi:hypothetical protein